MRFNVKIRDKTYDVKVGDLLSRPIQAEVDGEIFEIWPEESPNPSNGQQPIIEARVDEAIQSDESRKLEESNSLKSLFIKAPIPGVIIEINVKPGDSVEYGQDLCVLEAMKMKNYIRAGRSGTIDRILVAAGEQVTQNQTLMEYRREVLP